MKYQLCSVLLVLLVALGWAAEDAAKAGKAPKAKPYLYKAPGYMMLQVSKPIEFSILNPKTPTRRQALLTAKLPQASKARISGSSKKEGNNVLSNLKIAFNDRIVVSDTSYVDDLALNIETTLYANISYWKITRMSVNYTAKVDGKTYPGSNEDIYVDKVPGFTHSLADLNCQRGYSSCAPKRLSWTCDYQDFRSKELDEVSSDDQAAATSGADLLFPGLELQPFFKGAAVDRFGYNWDCDPLISSALWVSLLIGLLLLLWLFWSCDMISALNTPDRFDDPKGTPIMVPTTE